MKNSTPEVICLPGGVAPAAQRYAPLAAALGNEAELHLKDLQIYAGEPPPTGYSIDMELEAVDRFADALGLGRFHLVGYSGGGFISLAYAGTRPHRLLSLGLFEPASVPGELTTEEQQIVTALRSKLHGLTGAQFMATFMREQVKPGVQLPPPPGAPPPGLGNRPAGIAALIEAFFAYRFDRARLHDGGFPVYLGYGDLTHHFEAVKAGILARHFADIRIQRHPGIHHFVTPELIYNPIHVAALKRLWRDGEHAAGLTAELALQQ